MCIVIANRLPLSIISTQSNSHHLSIDQIFAPFMKDVLDGEANFCMNSPCLILNTFDQRLVLVFLLQCCNTYTFLLQVQRLFDLWQIDFAALILSVAHQTWSFCKKNLRRINIISPAPSLEREISDFHGMCMLLNWFSFNSIILCNSGFSQRHRIQPKIGQIMYYFISTILLLFTLLNLNLLIVKGKDSIF